MMLPSMSLPSLSWMLLSCLMLLSQVQGEDSPADTPSARISCPKGSMAYASYCYALFITPKTWMDADVSAGAVRGEKEKQIRDLESVVLVSFLKGTLRAFHPPGLHPLLGLEPNAGGWEWSSSDVLNYVAWERNPSTSSYPGYCGSLSRNTGYLKWRDYNCYVNLPYVCKFKG
uniref:C-type lectin domain-containing protein n=1 Tax=Sus scrofa TaxID=9823 RepID=A0A8D1VXB5_PIG